MKLRLLLVAAALALVPPALAAGPSVDARAYLVEDGRNGEVLLAHNEARQVPIASLTKMMTVLLTLERTQLTDEVTVTPYAAAVGESSVNLRAGERLTVRDLVEASLIQSANDAAWALAEHVGPRRLRPLRLDDEPARSATRALADTNFVRPDGLDAAGHVSSARDMTTLARALMQKPVVRQIVAMRDSTIEGGRRLHTWNDLLGTFPGVVGVKTGHTTAAGWSEVAAVRGPGVTVYATVIGSPARSIRNGDLVELMNWGLARFRVVSLISAGRVYARAETPYDREQVSLVAPRSVRRAVLVDRPLVERVVAPDERRASGASRASSWARFASTTGGKSWRARRSSPRVRSTEPSTIDRAGWYAGQAAHNMWGWIS